MDFYLYIYVSLYLYVCKCDYSKCTLDFSICFFIYLNYVISDIRY